MTKVKRTTNMAQSDIASRVTHVLKENAEVSFVIITAL